MSLTAFNCRLSESNHSSDSVILHSGGNSRAFRGIGVISAATAEPTACHQCQFGGFSLASRLPFQREFCNCCKKCSCNCNICTIFSFRQGITH